MADVLSKIEILTDKEIEPSADRAPSILALQDTNKKRQKMHKTAFLRNF